MTNNMSRNKILCIDKNHRFKLLSQTCHLKKTFTKCSEKFR